MLKPIFLLTLILSSLTTLAQVSKSELRQLQKESSFKIVTVDILGVNNKEAATLLRTNIESLQDVHYCEVDYQNNLCKIIVGFGVQKSDILTIIGRTGVKNSNYSEEIRWRTDQNSNKKISYTDEKSRATEVYTSEEAEERINQTKSKKQIEAELAKTRSVEQKKQEIGAKSATNLPDGYPIYEKTDSKEGDDEAYRIAKKEWIKNNPEKYRQMTKSEDNGVTEISRQEFQKMSIEKQKLITDNPDKFKITE